MIPCLQYVLRYMSKPPAEKSFHMTYVCSSYWEWCLSSVNKLPSQVEPQCNAMDIKNLEVSENGDFPLNILNKKYLES